MPNGAPRSFFERERERLVTEIAEVRVLLTEY